MSQTNCLSPSTAIDCLTIYVDTTNARLQNGNPFEFSYKFVVSAQGGSTIGTPQSIVEVLCSDAVVISDNGGTQIVTFFATSIDSNGI
jgi:hypothetical protein